MFLESMVSKSAILSTHEYQGTESELNKLFVFTTSTFYPIKILKLTIYTGVKTIIRDHNSNIIQLHYNHKHSFPNITGMHNNHDKVAVSTSFKPFCLQV